MGHEENWTLLSFFLAVPVGDGALRARVRMLRRHTVMFSFTQALKVNF
jgi:hypothetical protein